MNVWLALAGYQAVWFAAVIGASEGSAWPGVLAMLCYASAQLGLARRHRVDLLLMGAGLVLGLLVDGTLIRFGLATYAAGWPDVASTPAWMLALWMAFALTFSQTLRYLQSRLWLAALLGLVGGPAAYFAASRGWHVVDFTPPAWRGLLALSAGWAVATPVLARLARGASASSRHVAERRLSA